MATATIIDQAAITAATANSPFTPASRKNSILENATYSTPLPADTYTTCVGADGKVERFGYVAVADGTLTPEASVWRMDGEHEVSGAKVAHKAGEAILRANGQPSFKATGQYVRSTSGAKVRIYDSILNRLSVSSDPKDISLYGSLTSNGAHDVFFSGASNVAVEQHEVKGRDYTQANLVLAE